MKKEWKDTTSQPVPLIAISGVRWHHDHCLCIYFPIFQQLTSALWSVVTGIYVMEIVAPEVWQALPVQDREPVSNLRVWICTVKLAYFLSIVEIIISLEHFDAANML